MNDRFFLDTNIIVYSFDASAPKKQTVARELIADALDKGIGIISFQVVQEFLNVALKKFKQPLSAAQSRIFLDEVLLPLCEVYPDNEFYRGALTIKDRFGFSWYDSLIVHAAALAGCTTLYSEDLQHGFVLSELTIVNPF